MVTKEEILSSRFLWCVIVEAMLSLIKLKTSFSWVLISFVSRKGERSYVEGTMTSVFKVSLGVDLA